MHSRAHSGRLRLGLLPADPTQLEPAPVGLQEGMGTKISVVQTVPVGLVCLFQTVSCSLDKVAQGCALIRQVLGSSIIHQQGRRFQLGFWPEDLLKKGDSPGSRHAADIGRG